MFALAAAAAAAVDVAGVATLLVVVDAVGATVGGGGGGDVIFVPLCACVSDAAVGVDAAAVVVVVIGSFEEARGPRIDGLSGERGATSTSGVCASGLTIAVVALGRCEPKAADGGASSVATRCSRATWPPPTLIVRGKISLTPPPPLLLLLLTRGALSSFAVMSPLVAATLALDASSASMRLRCAFVVTGGVESFDDTEAGFSSASVCVDAAAVEDAAAAATAAAAAAAGAAAVFGCEPPRVAPPPLPSL